MFAETIPPDRSPDRITPGKALEPEKPLSQPPSTFETYMQETASQGKSALPGTGQPVGTSPMEITRGGTPSSTPTFDSLMTQARGAQDGLGQVERQLNTPNLKLKRSQTHLIKNKMQDANGHIRSAASKLGVENDPMKMPSGANPIGRFLAYIGDGQDQLVVVQQKLKELSAKQGEIRPGDMMLMQVKMSLAQQEIEYSSTLLGKVIESITTVLNTQL